MSRTRRNARNAAKPFLAVRASPCMRGRSRKSLTHQAPEDVALLGGSVDVRMNPLVSLFAASLIAFLPVHAMAQDVADRDEVISVRDRERPELDPLGAHLGAFTLNASIDFEVTSTDNLFASPSGGELDDVIYTVAPRARLASDWSRHSLALEAGAAFRSHEDFSNEDVDTHYFRGVGRLDVGADTDINASARIAHEFTPRTDPDSPFVGSPVEYDRRDASIGVSHRFARFGVRADASSTERDYDGAASVRDYDQTGIRGRVDIDLSPRIGLFVQAAADERDYDNSPASNSEGQSALVGATIDTDLMRGEVSVGQFERDYDGFGSIDGLAVAGRLEWNVTPLTTVTFDARRSGDDDVGLASGFPYVVTEYGARVDHELLRNVILTASVRAGEREYEGVARDDEYTSIELGGDYLLNRRVAIRARYQHDDVDSTVPARNFDVDAVTVGLSLRL